MELVRERQTIELTNVEAQQHNAQISERYRLLQSAEADQFSQVTHANESAAQAAPIVEETPVLEQMPHVTDFVHGKSGCYSRYRRKSQRSYGCCRTVFAF